MKKLLAEVTLESEQHLVDNVQEKIDDFKQDGGFQAGGKRKKKKKRKRKNRGVAIDQDVMATVEKKVEENWNKDLDDLEDQDVANDEIQIEEDATESYHEEEAKDV